MQNMYDMFQYIYIQHLCYILIPQIIVFCVICMAIIFNICSSFAASQGNSFLDMLTGLTKK